MTGAETVFQTPTVTYSIISLFVFLTGLCIGSFLNVCICRLPEGRSVVSPPSACPGCGHRLKWWENIPVISFLLLKGKCSGCGSRISWQYPVVELLTGLLALALLHKFHLSLQFAIMFLFSCGLIVVTFIDFAHRIIPDVISLPGIAAGIAASFFMPGITWLDSVLGALAGGGVLYLVTWGYYLATGKVGMGGGDIKLLAMIGAFLGWQSIPFIVFISSLVGAVAGIIFIIVSRSGRDYQIPFGPFLAMAAEIYIFFGSWILKTYLAGLSPGT